VQAELEKIESIASVSGNGGFAEGCPETGLEEINRDLLQADFWAQN
jgi:hypothetical protein